MNLASDRTDPLTMRDSGQTLQWQGLGLDGPIVDNIRPAASGT